MTADARTLPLLLPAVCETSRRAATNTLIHADLLQWLRDHQWEAQNGYLPKAHAVMGDPPYFLGSIVKRFGGKNAAPAQYGKDGAFRRQSRGFMGKTWDGFDDVWQYQAWVTEWSSLLLDFVYPGAILALFGGTRTYHRLAAGLEDAGWEVFDCMMYVYGSGFPKAADIGKLIDKSEGAEREIVGTRTSAFGTEPVGERGTRAGGDGGVGLWLGGDAKTVNLTGSPATIDAQRFDGYKTALKPAYEPIILARAPRGAATYADLAQTWGTGAINVDGGRITSSDDTRRNSHGGDNGLLGSSTFRIRERFADSMEQTAGRYPANLVFDDIAAAQLDAMSGESVSKQADRGTVEIFKDNGSWRGESTVRGHNDSGGASRFFYTAKAPSWEREAGLAEFFETTINDGRAKSIDNAYQRGETVRLNPHPTVKPIQLTEYIARLLLPPVLDRPRRILVPFAGVASEMIGAQLAGWDDIVGIERDAEYVPINEARRKWWGQFKAYAQAEAAYRPPVTVIDGYAGLPLFAALGGAS